MEDEVCSNQSKSVLKHSYSYSHKGVIKSIVLVDATKSLSLQLGTKSLLQLSTLPIKAPWPLAIDDDTNQLANRKISQKRKRGDDTEVFLHSLGDDLLQEVPVALEAILEGICNDAWVTLGEENGVVIATSQEGLPSWANLECHLEVKRVDEDIADMTPLSIEKESLCCNDQKVIHRLIVNARQEESMLDVTKADDTTVTTHVLMPPRSVFLLTNLLRSQKEVPRGWNTMIDFAQKNPPNLLLLDPPYPSHSAKRLKDSKNKYKPIDDLYDLWNMVRPVQELLECSKNSEHGVLVGCWVTNNAKAQRFVLTKLFPAWGLGHIGQVVWIKITAGDEKDSIPGGQLVFPMNNKQGRKPYEVLFLGHTKHKNRSVQSTFGAQLFASVPLDHSRKPPVLELLRDRLSSLSSSNDINVYELFARSLFSGPSSKGYWVSIGNEPFAFNQQKVRLKEQKPDHIQ